MRVCQKHMTKAVMTLTDKFEGTEYDLCLKCKEDFWKYVMDPDSPVKEVKTEIKRGRKKAN